MSLIYQPIKKMNKIDQSKRDDQTIVQKVIAIKLKKVIIGLASPAHFTSDRADLFWVSLYHQTLKNI
jgi:hypothetical protein